MTINNINIPFTPKIERNFKANWCDLIAFTIFFISIGLYVYGWEGMNAPYNSVASNQISLNPAELPYYTLRTTMRLVIGMFFSMIFAIVVGAGSAKNKHISRVMLPFINFMESVPLLGFLTFTTIFFLTMFPNSVMGLEGAAIFGVFTSQAWNMALVVYQTLKIVPEEVNEAARMFKLTGWQKFWRIEMPYSIPGLLWNTMVSQSAAWFALVGTEAIPVHGKTVFLPGIGSYIAAGLETANFHAIIYAVIALILNIVILDQICFRPLVRWSEKFKYENLSEKSHNTSWFYNVLTQTTLLPTLLEPLSLIWNFILNGRKRYLTINTKGFVIPKSIKRLSVTTWYVVIIILLVYCGMKLWGFFPKNEMLEMLPLMWKTTVRVTIAMLLSLLIFTPLGVWIGLSKKGTRIAQPIIQILAALPPDIFFPILTVFLIATHQSLNIWTIPLIMIGTQWYILFNVIAGVSTLPQEMLEVSKVFSIKGIMWWKKLIIPAIFPYIVTGIISAAGGAWNADITAEVLQWGAKTISCSGLGAFIADTTGANQTHSAALGVTAMCALVALCVIFVWKPLYKIAETKYKIS